MTVTAAFFYLFAAITVASAFMVIAARNPVHSVLFLILAFVNSAGLFILLGAEFLAMILIVVYVGAVAVLFLFRDHGCSTSISRSCARARCNICRSARWWVSSSWSSWFSW